MEEGDDGFNLIQPSLIQQLKTILDQYPDDGQILKVTIVETLKCLTVERYSFLITPLPFPEYLQKL